MPDHDLLAVGDAPGHVQPGQIGAVERAARRRRARRRSAPPVPSVTNPGSRTKPTTLTTDLRLGRRRRRPDASAVDETG